jgi:hypothetical protein
LGDAVGGGHGGDGVGMGGECEKRGERRRGVVIYCFVR